jgi:hypothetical protein
VTDEINGDYTAISREFATNIGPGFRATREAV